MRMNIHHDLKGWNDELKWMICNGNRKGWKVCLIRSVATETIYEVWRHRNNKSFGKNVNNLGILGIVIDALSYRGLCNPRLKKHIYNLIVD